jgi:polyisoprenyl-teichoic acid--peptidoglycan teichoic acid transferase
MVKKVIVMLFALGIIFAVVSFYLHSQFENGTAQKLISGISPSTKSEVELRKEKSIFSGKKVLNILLIGGDTSAERRTEGQLGLNTDVLIMISINPETNKVLLTSVPRYLWINGNKINSLYTIYGYDTLKDAYEKITGQPVDAFIQADFDSFRWIVDAFGGVPVQVQNSFTDEQFPKDDDSGAQTISFTTGPETMDGARALIFARSRHGDNGEGSDLKRAARQHLILQAMVKALSQPGSTFWPMDLPKFFTTVNQHMQTSLTLDDVYYLWDFYKDRDKYSVESFVVGSDYLYYPGMYPDSPYRAWVFIPIGDSYDKLHADIKTKLGII